MFFRLDRDDISPALTNLIARAKDKRPLLRAMGTTFKSITEGNFNSVGEAFRPLAWPAKRDGSPSILQRSTTLAKSFRLEITAETADLSNPMPYAAIHQFGGKTAPHKITPKKGKALSFSYLGAQVTVRSVNHPGSNIPARPFYPVANGKLTSKAETLIAAAGQRELAKQIS